MILPHPAMFCRIRYNSTVAFDLIPFTATSLSLKRQSRLAFDIVVKMK